LRRGFCPPTSAPRINTLIKLFALDVDGTLTDGSVYMDGEGRELKRFDIQDGYGLVSLRRAGVKVVFISGRFSKATEQRAQDLKIDLCINGTKEKLADLKKLAKQWNIERDEIAYAGDDVPDAECVGWAGLGIAVANAAGGLKAIADYVTERPGGYGAIRECAEYILKRNGAEDGA
jgi:3-deoxy-D-manno-octulosonate 8-phosphate phosphatase (KDO 8-P phosphatase)